MVKGVGKTLRRHAFSSATPAKRKSESLSSNAHLRVRTVRWPMHRVRRPVHAAPAAERGAVDPLPGLPKTRAQSHLHVHFADEAEAAFHFRGQEGGLHRSQEDRQGRIRTAVNSGTRVTGRKPSSSQNQWAALFSPSPPADGGEGRGEEELFVQNSPILLPAPQPSRQAGGPLPIRSSWG